MHNNVALKYCRKLIRNRNFEGNPQSNLTAVVIAFELTFHNHLAHASNNRSNRGTVCSTRKREQKTRCSTSS